MVGAEEIVARLIQAGLFDKAVDVSLQFNFPLEPIFEALASRYEFLQSMQVIYVNHLFLQVCPFLSKYYGFQVCKSL